MLLRTLALCLGLAAPMATGQEMASFVLPWDDATPGATDLSSWSHRPAGAKGFVEVSEDAHLQVGGERIRFVGVNIGPETIFTDADPAQREAFAARLAKFGVNAVRFHHMGAMWGPRNIFGANPNAKTTEVDAESYARFRGWVEAFKRHGIYTNLNLLVSRRFTAADGLPAEIESVGWKQQHVIGFWDEKLIELQRQYARQMLTTPGNDGGPLVDDPALAMVEINNENGLIHAWLSGDVEELPGVFTEPLRVKWNTWLAARYGGDSALHDAWGVRNVPLGEEMIARAAEWGLEQHQGAEAALVDDGEATRVTVSQPGSAGWHVQLNSPRFDLKRGEVYTLHFRASADEARTISVGVRQSASPWGNVGLQASPRLTGQMQEFSYTFEATEDTPQAQVTFSSLSQADAEFAFAGVSLRPGGSLGPPDGASLDGKTLPLFARSERWSQRARRDFVEFLYEVERDYWVGMRDFLKQELGVRVPVIGTIAGCSPVGIQAEMDAIDTHGYWQHPQFPGRPWDPANWTVGNKTIVNEADGATITSLAMYAVRGKPHLVTEYDHPSPNQYAGEAAPLLASYAALHDWDGIFFFAYGDQAEQWGSGRIETFFDWLRHPTKMANLVHAAAIFRRGDVSPAKEAITAMITRETELDVIARKSYGWSVVQASDVGVPKAAALTSRVEVISRPTDTRIRSHGYPTDGRADTGELHWGAAAGGPNVVAIDTPRTIGVIGAPTPFETRGFRIERSDGQLGWSTALLTLLEGESFEREPNRALLTVTGNVENTDMPWNAEKTSVGANWGEAPVRVEVVPATVTLPGRVKAYALDERGQRTDEEVAVQSLGDGKTVVRIGPPQKTIWYELVWE